MNHPVRGGPDGATAAAPRALFIHGAGAWGGQWAIWRRVFEAEGWTVDTPDLEPAPAGLAATRLDDYVAQAVGALASAPADALVGASLGGLVAMAAAGRPAERDAGAAALGAGAFPRTLVLVNPLPPAPFAARLPAFHVDGDRVPWRSQGRFDSTARALPAASFPDRHLAFRHWRDESAAVLREARSGVALPTPSMPTVVIASDADRDVPPALSAALAERMGAALLRVPGAHVDPVMGASAAAAARGAMAWLGAAAV